MVDLNQSVESVVSDGARTLEVQGVGQRASSVISVESRAISSPQSCAKAKRRKSLGKIKAAQENDSDTETSSRIVEERTAQLKGAGGATRLSPRSGCRHGILKVTHRR